MNKTNFTLTGGFPLEQDRLAFLQAAWSDAFKGLATLLTGGGTRIVVLSGCVVTGNTISDGVIAYQDEIFNFVGGAFTATNPTFLIKEASEPPQGLIYFDAATNTSQTKFPQRKRWVEMGTGAGAIGWNPWPLPPFGLASFFGFNTFVRGEIAVPIFSAQDASIVVPFAQPMQSDDYLILGSFQKKIGSTNVNHTNDMTWSTYAQTTTQFSLALNDPNWQVNAPYKADLYFRYLIVPFSLTI